MQKLIVLTAEPKNFVPLKIKEEADNLGLTTYIVDVKKTVLVEGLNEDGSLRSCLYQIKDTVFTDEKPQEIVKLEIDSETVIIPRLNEHHLEIKLGILKRLQQLGCKLVNTPEAMELCNDKLRSQVVLNTAGIRTPLSFTVQSLDDIDLVVNEFEENGLLKFPVILKTLRGTHGIGVMKLDSRSSLVSVAQTLAKEGLDFLIQEFCKHEQSCRIIMLGEEVLAANLRGQPKKKDEFRTNSHLGSETEKYEPSEEEIEMSRKIVKLFGSNFCAIDYIKLEDGSLMVLEVNGSPGLEAIQKNWPDKNLPATVAQFAKTFMVDQVATEVSTAEPEDTITVNQSVEDSATKQLQEIEQVMIHRVMSDLADGRIDTGAKTSALHVDSATVEGDRVKFKRGDTSYTVSLSREVRVKNVHGGESSLRPVVRLDLTIAGIRLNQVEFTLVNRSHMKYEVLIGRNVLEQLGLPVAIQSTGQAASSESDLEVEEE